MATVNQNELQRFISDVKRRFKNLHDRAEVRVTEGVPDVVGGEEEGDLAYDNTDGNLYIYDGDDYVVSVEQAFFRYASDVNFTGESADDIEAGRVTSQGDIKGFSENPNNSSGKALLWKGTFYGATPSTNSTAYAWQNPNVDVNAGIGEPSEAAPEGSIFFDKSNHNFYYYTDNAWSLANNYEWIKYATDVQNLTSNGTVSSSSSVTGFTDDISFDTRWEGKLSNQYTETESDDANDYVWRIITTNYIRETLIDLGFKPAEPINLAASEEIYNTNSAAGIKSRVNLTWNTPAPTGKATTAYSTVSYKRTVDENGDAVTESFTVFGDFTGTTILIPDLAVGVYTFAVAATSRLGVDSGTTELTSVPVEGLTANPDNVSGLSLNASQSTAQLSWNRSTELDVLVSGSSQIRHNAQTGSGVTWSTSQILVQSVQGSATNKTVPLLTGTYLVKFFDSGGRESEAATIITNTFAPSGFNFVANADQEPTFTGTKTNCSVVNNELRLTTGQMSMTYDFSDTIDLKAVQPVRVAPVYAAAVFNDSDLICNVVAVCDRTSVCQTQQDAEITFYIRYTQDDPSASPTYTDYELLRTGDYSARAFQIRMTASVGDTNTIISFSDLGASFDSEDKIITGSTMSSATEDTTVTFPNNGFYTGTAGTTLPRMGFQVIGGAAGDAAQVVSRTATGFTFNVYNGTTNTRKALSVDWQAIGQ